MNEIPMPDDDPFLTVKETAAHLRLCEKHIRRLIKRGELTAYSFGTAIRIKREDLDAFVAKRRVTPDKSDNKMNLNIFIFSIYIHYWEFLSV